MNNKLNFVRSGKGVKQQKKDKIPIKYVVFGCGVLGEGQKIVTDSVFISSKGKKIKAATTFLQRQRKYIDILTDKTYFKINGKIQLPMILLSSKNVEVMRKQVHQQIDDFFNAYKDLWGNNFA